MKSGSFELFKQRKVVSLARGPNEKAEQAKQLYEQGMKLVEIASQLNVSDGTVRSWKNRFNWDNKKTATLQNAKCNVAKDKKINNLSIKEPVADEVNVVLKNVELTEKQRLFCLYFIKSFNASKAYQKAYECDYATAMANGSSLLRNTKVKKQIEQLKQDRLNREFLTEADIFQRYMDIAFADMNDFVEFGQEEVPVIAKNGPVQIKDKDTGEEKILTETVNVLHFKESSEVDGTLISEIKEGKNGVSIKLADRMKALEWLAEHMNMATEEQKARIKLLNTQCERLNTDNNEDNPDKKEAVDNIAGILSQLKHVEKDDIFK